MRTHLPFLRLRRASLALASLLSLGLGARLGAQGCVVAHGAGLPASMMEGERTNSWDVSVAYRWFQSDRHFAGTTEHTDRQAEGSQVINRSNFIDVGLNYTLSPRYSLTMTIPFVVHDRSSVVRDNNRVILQRYHTQSAGIADMSIGGAMWIWDPVTPRAGNLQIGAGLVLPTGKDDVTDTFSVFDNATRKIVAQERTVDQSIQPGSGGYGLNLNAFGYRDLGQGFTGFANASYTITPDNKNGVPTFRSNVFEAVMSIPDSYLARIGVEYAIPQSRGWSLSLAGRIEGVPVRDLVGDSTGFRRPGYSVAIEPGLVVSRSNWSARLYVPFAVQRNRQQSVPDKFQTQATGRYALGDAAFADYLIMFSVSHRL
jgi:hypothetical protein